MDSILITKNWKSGDESGYVWQVSWGRDSGKEARHFATISEGGQEISFCCTKYAICKDELSFIYTKMNEIQRKYFKLTNPCAEEPINL